MTNNQNAGTTECIKEDKKLIARNGVLMEKTGWGAKAVYVAQTMGEKMKAIGTQYQKCADECTAGRIAEKYHKGTFNISTARNGRTDLKARTTASNGQPYVKSDIEILRNGMVVDGAQVKYYKTPLQTTFHISHPKYDGLQKVCPAEQAGRVLELSGKRGTSTEGDVR